MCLSNEMKCSGGECINKLWKCDGEINCADGSDEVDCGKYEADVDLDYTGVEESVFIRHAATLNSERNLRINYGSIHIFTGNFFATFGYCYSLV